MGADMIFDDSWTHPGPYLYVNQTTYDHFVTYFDEAQANTIEVTTLEPEPPKKASTYGRAKNPMVRTDKKLQRGF